jgi:membrane-associated protein
MEWFQEFFLRLHHLDELIAWAGYIGITLIVFCETGLLAGFFLPGDSLLVTAGLVASQGKLDIVRLNLLLMAAAILGDSAGYWIGAVAGPRIFKKEDSFFFRKEHLRRTHAFFEKHGGKTIVLARFVPIIRTFAPTVAGVGKMSYGKFLSYNVFGGIGWVAAMTLTGYFLGRSVPNIEKHLHLVIFIVIIVSFLPIIHEVFSARKKKIDPSGSE